jgi:D-proline reductase (dithiol) PrdB
MPVERDKPVAYIARIREKYATLGYPEYRWVLSDTPPPWQPLLKPLAECRLGLIASGGIYVTGQVAFHYKDDTSYRVIPTSINTADLRATHFAYDLTDARRDPNVVFPLEPLHQMVTEGIIGALAAHAFTFMGGIYSARRVREELAPQLTERLREDNVDILLLVPV